jgi:hypothetical protein
LCTRERIVASPVEAARSATYAQEVAAAPRSTYVLFRGRPRDNALRAVLDARGLRYTHADTGSFSIYFLDERVAPQALATVWTLPSP